MKKIDTSAITSGSWMPILGNWNGNNFVNGSPDTSLAGLDFLQQAYFECINALSQFLINDPTQPTILYIAPPPSAGPELVAAIATEGFMSYQGEIYAFSFSIMPRASFNTQTLYQNASIVTNFSSADPITFSDATRQNVHQVRQVQFSWSTTRNAGNLPDYDLWMNVNNNSYAAIVAQNTLNTFITGTYDGFITNYNNLVSGLINPAPIPVPPSGTNGFQNYWGNASGIPHRPGVYPSPLSYYCVLNRVYLWGEITNTNEEGASASSTIFTLPSGYCPIAYEEVFEVCEIGLASGPVTSSGKVNGTPSYYLVVCNNGDVKLLGAAGAHTISLSGINFLQGSYSLESEVYSSALDEEVEFTYTE